MKKTAALLIIAATAAISLAGWEIFSAQPAAAATADPTVSTSTYTFINNVPTGCPASSPSCNVALIGGGSMYFSTAVNSAGRFYGNIWFYRPEYNDAVSGLAPVLNQIVSGKPGCNTTNQYSLTIPSTSATDSAGRSVTIAMTQILTQYYANGSGKGGGGSGCHWEALNGTTTLTLGVGVMVPSAGLTITKTVDNATPLPDTTLHYLLTTTARGPATSTGVTVNDILPTGLSFVSATSSVGSYSESTGIWTIGDMAPSSSATLSIAAMVTASDTAGQVVINTARANESVINPDAAGAASSATITVGTSGSGGGSTTTTSTALMAPTNLKGIPTRQSVTLNWTGSIGGVSPIIYTILRNGTSVGSTTSTRFTDNGLTSSTTYSYVIRVTDSATTTATTATSTQITVTTLGKKSHGGDGGSEGGNGGNNGDGGGHEHETEGGQKNQTHASSDD